jgi:hypothetical protein
MPRYATVPRLCTEDPLQPNTLEVAAYLDGTSAWGTAAAFELRRLQALVDALTAEREALSATEGAANLDTKRLDFLDAYNGPEAYVSVWKSLIGSWNVEQGNGEELEAYAEERVVDGAATVRAAIDSLMGVK